MAHLSNEDLILSSVRESSALIFHVALPVFKRPTLITKMLFTMVFSSLVSFTAQQVQLRTLAGVTTASTLTVTPAPLVTGISASITDISGAPTGGVFGVGTTISFFGSEPTILGSTVTTTSVIAGFTPITALAYMGNGGLLVLHATAATAYFNLQYSAPSFAFTLNSARSITAAPHSKNLEEAPAILPNTMFAIMNTMAGPTCSLIKYVVNPASFTTTVNSNLYLNCSATRNLNTVNSDYFSGGNGGAGADLRFYIFTTINLGLVKTIPVPANVNTFRGFSDSNDWMIFYEIIRTNAPLSTQVVKVNITEKDNGVAPSVGSPYTLAQSTPAGAIEIKTISMLGLFANSDPIGTAVTVIFLYKRDLTAYSFITVTTTDIYMDRTIVQFPDTLVNFTHYIGAIANQGPSYFYMAYKLSLDKCDLIVQSTCRKCEVDYYRTIQDDPSSSCINKPMFLPGYGADDVSNVVRPCDNIGCLSCANNFTQCTDCMAEFQLTPANVCKPFVPVNIALIQAPRNINNSDYTFWMVPSVNFTYANFAEIAQNMSIQAQIFTVGKSKPLPQNVTSIVKVIRNQIAELQVTINPLLVSQDSVLSINWPNNTDLLQDGITYKIMNFSQNITLKEPHLTFGYFNEMKKYKLYSYAMSYVMGAEVTSQMLVFYLDLALVLDPTQIGIRLVQSYKIYNKLKYVNVELGAKTQYFLEGIGEVLIGPQEFSKDLDAKKPTGTKGRLTTLKLGLDFTGLYAARFFIYLTSFGMRFFSDLVVKKRMELQVWLLAVAFYAPRLHCVLFNLICVDFMFYGFRDLLHMSGTDFPNIMAFFAAIFITWDIALLFKSGTNDRNWKLEFIIQNRGFAQSGIEDVIVVTEPDAPKDEDEEEDSEEQEKRKIVKRAAVDSIEEAKIDYAKTFFELGRDAGTIWFLTRHLRLNEKVYEDRWCRFYSIFKLIKACIYGATIVGSQYCPMMQGLLYVFIEAFMMGYVVFKFMKLKFISPFLLTIDLLQGLALFFFAILSMNIYTAQEGRTATSDAKQVTICFIIIMATIGEFVLSWVEVIYVLWNHMQGLKGEYASSYSWLRFLYRDLGYYDYIESKINNQPYKLTKTFFSSGEMVEERKKKIKCSHSLTRQPSPARAAAERAAQQDEETQDR